jgi:phage antirepressor YoqD-like protein
MQLIKSERFGSIACDFWQDQNGEIWMTREQIGRALEYADPDKAIANIHDRNHDRLDKFSTTLNLRKVEGNREVTRGMTVYSYKGIYEICRFSRQPKADAFMDWVWDVIENIRKTGMYSILSHVKLDSKFMYQIARTLEEKEQQIATLTPKAESYDTFMNAVGNLTINEAAKSLSIRGIGQNKLFEILRKEQVLYKNGNYHLPYQEYINSGCFIVKQHPIKKGDVIELYSQVFVTPKGLDWLSKLLKQKGYTEVAQDGTAHVKRSCK